MLKGVFTALITPFKDDLSLDEEGLVENIDFQVNQGVDGLVLLGTTGESTSLTDNEQEKAIKLAVRYFEQHPKKKIPLLIGTGSPSTTETLKKTAKAKDLGADGALIVTPYYNRPTQEGIAQHFEKIADICRFPIMLYNIQGRTGQNIETDTLKRLMEIPEIIGVKEASGNLSQIMDVIAATRPDFTVMSGDDSLTLPVITLGGHGVISVLSNLLPALMKELTSAAIEGRIEKAKTLHYQLLPLFRIAFIESNPSPIKTLMKHAGMKAGNLRLPLVSPTEDHVTRIIQCYEEMLTLQN